MRHDLSSVVVAERLAELRALCELTDYLHGARVVTVSRAREIDEPSACRTIRPVEARDLEAARAALVETWHATYDDVMGVDRVTEITDDWHAIENLRTEIGRPDHAFLLVEVGGDVVANGSASRVGDDAIVQRLYVRPRHQGAGHGAALLDALLAQLGSVARVTLNVATHNVRAIAFYERHGFAIAGRPDDEHYAMIRSVASRGDDFVLLRKGG